MYLLSVKVKNAFKSHFIYDLSLSFYLYGQIDVFKFNFTLSNELFTIAQLQMRLQINNQI